MKKGTNRNKRILLAAGILSAAFLCGDLLYEPDLMNDSLPFIDLTGSIEQAMGNAKEAYAQGINDPDAPEIRDDESVADVYVYVYAETIRIEERSYSVISFGNDVRSGRYEGKTVHLVDNYAETTMFKQLIEILEEGRDKTAGYTIESK